MENLIGNIASFGVNASSRGVSRGWNEAITLNNQQILQSLMRKYSQSRTIGDAIRDAFRNKDIDSIKRVTVDYKGSLPIDWSQFISNRWNTIYAYRKLKIDLYNEYTSRYLYSDEQEMQDPSIGYRKRLQDLLRQFSLSDRSTQQVIIEDSKSVLDLDLFDEIIRTVPNGRDLLKSFLQKGIMSESDPQLITWMYLNDMYNPDAITYNSAKNNLSGMFAGMYKRSFYTSVILNDNPSLITNAPSMIKASILLMTIHMNYGDKVINSILQDKDAISKYLDRIDDIRPYGRHIPMFIRILDSSLPQDIKDKVFTLSYKYGLIDIFDRYIHKDNAINYMALLHTDYTQDNILMNVLQWKNLRPEWFQFYYVQGEPRPPKEFWTKLLASAIAYDNLNLVTRMLLRHANEITAQMREKMMQLSVSQKMKSLIG